MNQVPEMQQPACENTAPRVGLYVTCLVNTMRPSVGFSALQLLEDAGCDVSVPERQSCCGQPAYNSGDDEGTRAIAKQIIEAFEQFDYTVVPSGSCGAMIKVHFVELFAKDDPWLERARRLAEKTYELLSFLDEICHYRPTDLRVDAKYTYHHSCSGLRELNVYQQPFNLLEAVEALEVKKLNGDQECCGFGGTFCVKQSDLSNQIVTEKVTNVRDSGASLLLGGDMGCLMNMAGKLSRQGNRDISVMHTAELLAGMLPDNVEQ